MQTSYQQLIADHAQIENDVTALLIDLDDATIAPSELAGQLAQLASSVGAHIAVEDAMLASFDRDTLSGPWAAGWGAKEAAFLELRTDWAKYLDQWNWVTIERDRGAFTVASRAMFGRLQRQLEMETDLLYATALQASAITLR